MSNPGPNPPNHPASRNLEVISKIGDAVAKIGDAAAGPTPPAFSERRRRPRLCVPQQLFRLTASGKVFSVMDVSPEGMSLRVLEPADLLHFSIGAMIEGTLNLRHERLAVRARSVRVGRSGAGFQFEHLSDEASRALHALLDPARLGLDLQAVPSAEDGAIWYHGRSGTDLLLWRGWDGGYRRLALYVLGSFILWDEKDGLATGQTAPPIEEAEGGALAGGGPGSLASDGVMARLETLRLDHDARPDPGKLDIAKKLIVGSNLPQDPKKWCLRHLAPPS